MVSVQEQSAELNDEVGVCVCVAVCSRACVCMSKRESEVGLRGPKFNNNPVTF